MQFKLFAIVVVAIVVFAFAVSYSEAAYRKPPFNGSIFGKRGSTVTEYDSTGKALTAMCEIANEACQSWFPSQEK